MAAGIAGGPFVAGARLNMLCDSNILIYAAEPGLSQVNAYVQSADACIAIISHIEVLGFPRFDTLDSIRQARLEELVATLPAIPLDDAIVHRAIVLRRQKKMSVADAIVAATALECDMPLVTRNEADFKHIAGLKIINPFDVP